MIDPKELTDTMAAVEEAIRQSRLAEGHGRPRCIVFLKSLLDQGYKIVPVSESNHRGVSVHSYRTEFYDLDGKILSEGDRVRVRIGDDVDFVGTISSFCSHGDYINVKPDLDDGAPSGTFYICCSCHVRKVS